MSVIVSIIPYHPLIVNTHTTHPNASYYHQKKKKRPFSSFVVCSCVSVCRRRALDSLRRMSWVLGPRLPSLVACLITRPRAPPLSPSSRSRRRRASGVFGWSASPERFGCPYTMGTRISVLIAMLFNGVAFVIFVRVRVHVYYSRPFINLTSSSSSSSIGNTPIVLRLLTHDWPC